MDEEIFGPLVHIYLYDSFEEAIELANDSQYGLSCSVYTKSKRKFRHALNSINSGIINWNNPTTGASAIAPFGGMNNSGNNSPGGFNMIDHCVIPVGSTQQSHSENITYPGLNA